MFTVDVVLISRMQSGVVCKMDCYETFDDMN